MIPPTNHEPPLKMTGLIIVGLVGLWLAFVMGWTVIWKIYIDVPMLLVLSNIVTGIASSLTTLLVGRTISQLNQQSDVRNQPDIPAIQDVNVTNPPSDPANVEVQTKE